MTKEEILAKNADNGPYVYSHAQATKSMQEYVTQEKQSDIEDCINSLADLWRSLKQLSNQTELSEHHIRRMDNANAIMQRYADPNQPRIVQSTTQEKQNG